LWKKKFPNTPIGSTYFWNHDAGRDNSLLQRPVLWGKYFWQDFYFLRSLRKYSDFIGVNYYTSNSFFFGKSGGRFGWHGTNNWHSPTLWKSFPRGLYKVLLKVGKFGKPILILENGKPTNSGIDDVNRQKFLKRSIEYMHRAMAEGIDVRGYFYYSLGDSYEWDSGYTFKFGLVEIDRTTGKRTPRKSCNTYRDIIKQHRG
jgi:beta-glucosidase